jgi:hypothetical protein
MSLLKMTLSASDSVLPKKVAVKMGDVCKGVPTRGCMDTEDFRDAVRKTFAGKLPAALEADDLLLYFDKDLEHEIRLISPLNKWHTLPGYDKNLHENPVHVKILTPQPIPSGKPL